MNAVARPFVPRFRAEGARAFDPWRCSSAGRTVEISLWGREHTIYANANLSIYSSQQCNAACGFCVERLRPVARGTTLGAQKRIEPDDGRYFAALEECLEQLVPLDPSVSLTGGEPSLDPRLPRLLRVLAARGMRKRTMTTNGSGLLERREGALLVELIGASGVRHLNISRAHSDDALSASIMAEPSLPTAAALANVVMRARALGTRVRLSCVLLGGAVDDVTMVDKYLRFAASLGVDNVVFRQLMLSGDRGHIPRGQHAAAGRNVPVPDPVVSFSDRKRVRLRPLLDEISARRDFAFLGQIVGYYYYVEVWRWQDAIDVVFEEADLRLIEVAKHRWPGLVFELVFHPSGWLSSTWQPWDGVLGPPADAAVDQRLAE